MRGIQQPTEARERVSQCFGRAHVETEGRHITIRGPTSPIHGCGPLLHSRLTLRPSSPMQEGMSSRRLLPWNAPSSACKPRSTQPLLPFPLYVRLHGNRTSEIAPSGGPLCFFRRTSGCFFSRPLLSSFPADLRIDGHHLTHGGRDPAGQDDGCGCGWGGCEVSAALVVLS